jgi:hypothetical protein
MASRHLLAAAAVVVVSAAGGVAHADVIGAYDIHEYYAHLSLAEQQGLGWEVGEAVVAGGDGAKQLYDHGAIYWRESSGAVMVHWSVWPRYKQLGAETGELGWPADEVDADAMRLLAGEDDLTGKPIRWQDFANGALVAHPRSTTARKITSSMFEVWKKNGRGTGPLGYPVDDTVLEFQSSPGLPFPMLKTAKQTFDGAVVDWSFTRMMLGLPAWNAEVDTKHTARAGIEYVHGLQVRQGEDSNGSPTYWDWTDHHEPQKSFWVHGRGAESYRVKYRLGYDGPTSTHRVRPWFEVNVGVYGGILSFGDFRLGYDAIRPLLNDSRSKLIPKWFSAAVSAGHEKVIDDLDPDVGFILGPYYDGNPEDYMSAYALVVSCKAIKKTDIVF